MFLNFFLPKGQLCFKSKRNETVIVINWKKKWWTEATVLLEIHFPGQYFGVLSDLLQNNKSMVWAKMSREKVGAQTRGNNKQLVHLSPFLTIPFSLPGN
jgi:hypothetical protein